MANNEQQIKDLVAQVAEEKAQGVQDKNDYTNNDSYVRSMHNVLKSFKQHQVKAVGQQGTVNKTLAQACAPKHEYTNPQPDDAKLMKHTDSVF
jgi:hypothetical protein